MFSHDVLANRMKACWLLAQVLGLMAQVIDKSNRGIRLFCHGKSGKDLPVDESRETGWDKALALKGEEDGLSFRRVKDAGLTSMKGGIGGSGDNHVLPVLPLFGPPVEGLQVVVC